MTHRPGNEDSRAPRVVDRRDALKAFGLAIAAPLVSSAPGRRRRVGVVGGGLAGVATAWLLDGACDVVLLEAERALGGNVRSLALDLDGHDVVVDVGAQYFHPGPYPTYAALLTTLGLLDERHQGAIRSFIASFTVSASGELLPRFVSPWYPGRVWPFLTPWNWAGLIAFAILFGAAQAREQRDESWSLTLDDWLPTLGLPRDQWEGVLLPWTASLFSGVIDDARGASARAALVFAAKALPPHPLEPVTYRVLKPGLIEVINRLVAQTTTVHVITDAQVVQVGRTGGGQVRVRCADGRTHIVDELVLAASGPSSLRLAAQLPGAELQAAALRGFEFFDARLAIHRDAAFAWGHDAHWSFLNCDVRHATCEASMWMRDVVTGAPVASTSRLWKSWVTHRELPADILHEASFRHVSPSVGTIGAAQRLHLAQGRGRVWVAGGYTREYDSQETALLSAMSVADGMGVRSARMQGLLL